MLFLAVVLLVAAGLFSQPGDHLCGGSGGHRSDGFVFACLLRWDRNTFGDSGEDVGVFTTATG
jgi:hypothetical protein